MPCVHYGACCSLPAIYSCIETCLVYPSTAYTTFSLTEPLLLPISTSLSTSSAYWRARGAPTSILINCLNRQSHFVCRHKPNTTLTVGKHSKVGFSIYEAFQIALRILRSRGYVREKVVYADCALRVRCVRASDSLIVIQDNTYKRLCS